MRSWAPGLLEIDREFARLGACRTGVGVRHRAGSRRNAQLANPTGRTASAEEVHVAREWRVRLAGVPEVAVAAFRNTPLSRWLPANSTVLIPSIRLPMAWARRPVGFTWRPTSSAMTALVTRGFAPVQLISTRHAAVLRYSACTATPSPVPADIAR